MLIGLDMSLRGRGAAAASTAQSVEIPAALVSTTKIVHSDRKPVSAIPLTQGWVRAIYKNSSGVTQATADIGYAANGRPDPTAVAAHFVAHPSGWIEADIAYDHGPEVRNDGSSRFNLTQTSSSDRLRVWLDEDGIPYTEADPFTLQRWNIPAGHSVTRNNTAAFIVGDWTPQRGTTPGLFTLGTGSSDILDMHLWIQNGQIGSNGSDLFALFASPWPFQGPRACQTSVIGVTSSGSARIMSCEDVVSDSGNGAQTAATLAGGHVGGITVIPSLGPGIIRGFFTFSAAPSVPNAAALRTNLISGFGVVKPSTTDKHVAFLSDSIGAQSGATSIKRGHIGRIAYALGPTWSVFAQGYSGATSAGLRDPAITEGVFGRFWDSTASKKVLVVQGHLNEMNGLAGGTDVSGYPAAVEAQQLGIFDDADDYLATSPGGLVTDRIIISGFKRQETSSGWPGPGVAGADFTARNNAVGTHKTRLVNDAVANGWVVANLYDLATFASPPTNLADAVHPNDTGYDAIDDVVLPLILAA